MKSQSRKIQDEVGQRVLLKLVCHIQGVYWQKSWRNASADPWRLHNLANLIPTLLPSTLGDVP